jgi:hypothetical protein
MRLKNIHCVLRPLLDYFHHKSGIKVSTYGDVQPVEYIVDPEAENLK